MSYMSPHTWMPTCVRTFGVPYNRFFFYMNIIRSWMLTPL